jgi:hypothetical protein
MEPKPVAYYTNWFSSFYSSKVIYVDIKIEYQKYIPQLLDFCKLKSNFELKITSQIQWNSHEVGNSSLTCWSHIDQK